MAHLFTINYPGGGFAEIHVLSPGQIFPKFGGSNAGLLVEKTPSIIVHRDSGHDISDTEYSTCQVAPWKLLAYAIEQGYKISFHS